MKEESSIAYPEPATEERQLMMPNSGNGKHPLEPSPLKELLSIKEKTAVEKQLVHGVVIGELLRLYSDSAFVNVPEYGLNYVAAKFICAHDLLKDRKQVAIMFEGGNTDKPMIIGAMEEQKTKTVTIDKKERVLIEAEQEIELRCGESSILLTNDGRILLRGNYVSSQATATQRIRGGSVQIN